ncbi:SOS response-associated peptidase [Lichenihabitans sp. Uapishka_5]|uniref:SOS response-associated peptidase n=1 Tax=Lichenihabitans sp. Uapishka_5 TaxID=3037302 RepID=UPI0029E7E02E|nr:SOS response-associated peptidase [Lichenihabitans sp. Uapishka_5]MDX7950900.1 SOS response-associated peptidase [Lichenihabitans sp. Uapishka_5]
MCGRFTQHYTWAEVHRFLSVIGTPLNLQPRYNIAPTTTIDVVRLDREGRRELVRMRWGLVPAWWSKTLRDVPATFNARAETVAAKPMFRDAFRQRRCIVPASGFYEWTGPKGARVPHLFTAGDGSPVLGFAGLWDRWRDPDTGAEILSATIVVSDASDWMVPYHDRMPVLLTPDGFDAWLSGRADAAMLRPAAADALRQWIVTDRVNRTGQDDDDPSLTEAVA